MSELASDALRRHAANIRLLAESFSSPVARYLLESGCERLVDCANTLDTEAAETIEAAAGRAKRGAQS